MKSLRGCGWRSMLSIDGATLVHWLYRAVLPYQNTIGEREPNIWAGPLELNFHSYGGWCPVSYCVLVGGLVFTTGERLMDPTILSPLPTSAPPRQHTHMHTPPPPVHHHQSTTTTTSTPPAPSLHTNTAPHPRTHHPQTRSFSIQKIHITREQCVTTELPCTS